VILSEEEVARLIESASTSYHRVILMTLYGTGLRREELCRLKVTDVDSQRMVIHVRQGKGNRDRDVPLSPRLLEVLRAYWKWRKPKTYLFPSYYVSRQEKPITSHTVWNAVVAARRAGIRKRRADLECVYSALAIVTCRMASSGSSLAPHYRGAGVGASVWNSLTGELVSRRSCCRRYPSQGNGDTSRVRIPNCKG